MKGKVVIIGAGHAGGRCSLRLRQKGYQGEIDLIGKEPDGPYERPPLSKGLLTGKSEFAACQLATRVQYRDQAINLRTGHEAVTIDAQQRFIRLIDGSRIGFDRLVLATGGRCRQLTCSGSDLGNIHVLRDISHSQAIRAALRSGPDVVIVGGGFIGLEVAASAVALGCRVTVIEAAAQLLGRVLPVVTSRKIQSLHESRGVEFRLGAEIASFDGREQVAAVRLSCGEVIPAKTVIIGIGIDPEIGLAVEAGLEVKGPPANTIVANGFCQTSEDHIYAIGDCVSALNGHYGHHVRLESWQNAEQQAELVASHLCNNAVAWQTVPWFWSDQYEYNIQMAGMMAGHDQIVERQEPTSGAHYYFALCNQKLVGAVGMGPGTCAARDLRVAQRLIEKNRKLDPALLGDDSFKLKQLLKS